MKTPWVAFGVPLALRAAGNVAPRSIATRILRHEMIGTVRSSSTSSTRRPVGRRGPQHPTDWLEGFRTSTRSTSGSRVDGRRASVSPGAARSPVLTTPAASTSKTVSGWAYGPGRDGALQRMEVSHMLPTSRGAVQRPAGRKAMFMVSDARSSTGSPTAQPPGGASPTVFGHRGDGPRSDRLSKAERGGGQALSRYARKHNKRSSSSSSRPSTRTSSSWPGRYSARPGPSA